MNDNIRKNNELPLEVQLMFMKWDGDGYEPVELSLGSFHTGTLFDASIGMNEADKEDLLKALNKGFKPVFVLEPKIKRGAKDESN